MNNNKHCDNDMAQAYGNIPVLRLLKEPVSNAGELYRRYPDGGEPGWFAFVNESRTFFYWDGDSKRWRALEVAAADNGDIAVTLNSEAALDEYLGRSDFSGIIRVDLQTSNPVLQYIVMQSTTYNNATGSKRVAQWKFNAGGTIYTRTNSAPTWVKFEVNAGGVTSHAALSGKNDEFAYQHFNPLTQTVIKYITEAQLDQMYNEFSSSHEIGVYIVKESPYDGYIAIQTKLPETSYIVQYKMYHDGRIYCRKNLYYDGKTDWTDMSADRLKSGTINISDSSGLNNISGGNGAYGVRIISELFFGYGAFAIEQFNLSNSSGTAVPDNAKGQNKQCHLQRATTPDGIMRMRHSYYDTDGNRQWTAWTPQ